MACGILDENGRDSGFRPCSDGARCYLRCWTRGRLFQLGYRPEAMAQGVEPTTISSDLHTYNVNGPVYDLVNVVNKFLYLGMSIDDALAKVTSVPAETILMPGQVGTLAVDAWGDAVIFERREGEFQLVDANHQVRVAKQVLEPVVVIKGGQVYRQRRASR